MGSEEYLASLGIDTSDVDRAVDQTITILGHLGAQFDNVFDRAERASRALSGTSRAAREQATAAEKAATANRGWAQSLGSVSKNQFSGPQNNIYEQLLREQTAYDQKRQQMAEQNRQSLVTMARDEHTIRQRELADLRAAIQGRAAESDQIRAQEGNLARLRYAVYDVSNALMIGGVATAAFVGGIVSANISFERSFADVRRTVGVTGDDADRLYQRFIRLSTEIPVAFSEISEIGSLAGQLGIAEDRVASFTETTAMFGATTDVTTEAAATAFGRLDSLIDGVNGRYKNLASSILNVGINSVATESQIISIASQIAATGNQAGLTADEIVGLSASLASLGIAPEAARGTILRVFSQINSAVSQGGERLNDFASISGMTADEFRQSWGSDFTTTFLAFLKGVDANGTGAESTLRALGITAARDLNAMLKLSQNTEAVASNLRLAEIGFNDASILAENFGIIAETNASRLQVLIQTVQAFAASVGEATSGPLSYFLDYLQRVLQTMIAFSQTPVGQGVAAFTTVLGGTLAVMLLLGAVGLRTAGSFLALKTAIGETYLQTMLARGGMQGFTASLFGAAGGAAAFGAALKATGVGLLVTTGLWLLGEAIAFVGDQMRSGADKATEYFGSLDGLAEAIRSDNASVFAAQLERANEAIADAGDEGGDWVATLKAAAEAQAELSSKTDEAGGAIDAQTLRIGRNTQEWLRNALAQSSAFQEIFANLDQLNKLTGSSQFSAYGTTVDYQAFDLAEYVNIASTQGTAAANAFFDAWLEGLAGKFAEAGAGNPLASTIEALGGTETTQQVYEAGEQIGNALTEGLAQAASNDARNALLDAVLGPLADGADEASSQFKGLMDDVFGVINAEFELADATRRLGADFVQNGADVASSGQAMQAVIGAIYASSSGAPEAASRMQGLFNALVSGGYASVQQLAPLAAIIAGLAGGGSVKAAAFDMTSFAQGIDSVGKSAGGGGGGGGAAKQIRTLVDYANDLRQVFSRSFDIRFGGSQGADEIASGWIKIQDAIAKTNEEIAKYQQEMQELAADKAVREYWLMVAENYGDALRAGELRAELTEIDNKLTATAGDLSDAQARNSKTLIGNSKAAIENRAEILGMVQSYQDYIAALAASGVPQAELLARAAQLKAEFIAQATQLGYNSAELGIYAAAFDDVTVAINNVPRNITVTANVNPALQALNELEARARQVGSASYGGPTFDGSGIAKQARALAILAQITELQSKMPTSHFSGAGEYAAMLRAQIAALTAQLNSGSYRSGTSWTGSGNPWDVAGVVHNREAVLNSRATQIIPRQFIDMANQGRNPFAAMPGTGSSVKFPKQLEVTLSPLDRELVAAGANVTVYLDADQVATKTSAANSSDSRRGGG